MNENRISPQIPLVNVQRQYELIRAELLAETDRLFASGSYIQGPYAKKFEEAASKLFGFKHVAACGNGTAAVSVLLRAHKIGPGDEVIIPNMTFIATAESVIDVGATPIYCDVKPSDYTIDPEQITKKLTSKTKAIIPVHLFGHACDMKAIAEIARANSLVIIEDCAQAHLTRYQNTLVGTQYGGGAFSFYPGKNLGAFGDAGMIGSNSAEIDDFCRRFIDHGRSAKYQHEFIGFNHRMDAIQALVLLKKIEFLPKWTERRRTVANLYKKTLEAKGFKCVNALPDSESSWHLFTVEVGNRDAAVLAMQSQGIGVGVHYPIPLHQQPAVKKTSPVRDSDFPISNRACTRLMSLPLCGEIRDHEVDQILDVFLKVAQATR